MMMCMAGTDMGEKSKAAMETCGDGKNTNERSLGGPFFLGHFILISILS